MRQSRSLTADRHDAALLGVCSGFARWAGWNVFAVRIGLIALTLFALGPLAILAYLLIGWTMRL